MMERFVLVRPTMDHAAQVDAYRQAFLDCGDSMDGCGPLRRMETPEAYICACLDGEDAEKIPADMVPATQFFFVRQEDNKVVGMIQVRHFFNEYLEKYAGHIGYSVRPDERRKGYAKKMLAMALPFCRELGLERVLIACVDGNFGSERVILANGGVYESTVYEPRSGRALKRFWIAL